MFELIKLFFIFFKIGLFTFGGGYAMIPMIRQEMVSNNYLTLEQVTQFIGIAESTPGPFAINMATFSGYHTFGFVGSLVATLGVLLPSFIIILLIAYFSDRFLNTKPAKAILYTLKPLIIGLILSAGLSVVLHAILGDYMTQISFDYIALGIFGFVFILSLFYKKMSPIHMVLVSSILGMILYGL